MSDFSDRPFAVGSLTGLRAFKVDSLGRLRAPQQDTIWKPGENVAECRQGYMVNPFAGSMYRIGGTWHSVSSGTLETPGAKKEEHRAGSVKCACGFYAYTDGHNDYHDGDGTVEAVVEGYGLATVGSRGFRSEKARLVALIVPDEPSNPGRFTRRERWRLAVNVVGGASSLVGLVSVIAHSYEGWMGIAAPIFFAALMVLNAFGIVAVLDDARRRRRNRPEVKTPDVTETLRLYPDVKVYASREEALAAHPLTVPPKPNPETVEDFWTNTGLKA